MDRARFSSRPGSGGDASGEHHARRGPRAVSNQRRSETLRHGDKGLPISFSVRIDLPFRLIAGADFQVLSMNEIRPGPWPMPHAWQTSANTRSAISSPARSRLVVDEDVAFEARLAGMIRGRPAGARIADAVRAGAHAFLREAAARPPSGYAWPSAGKLRYRSAHPAVCPRSGGHLRTGECMDDNVRKRRA